MCGASVAIAADPVGPVSAEQFNRMFFFEAEGSYAISAGDPTLVIPGFALKVLPPSGARGAVRAGVTLDGGFDIAAGVTAAGLPSTALSSGGINFTTDAYFVTGDLEAGYTIPGADSSIRVFGGLRALKWHDNLNWISPAGGGIPGTTTVDTFGVGPHIGFDAEHRLGDSIFSLFGGASAAYLFGHLDETGAFSGGFAPPTQSIGRNVINLDGRIGVSAKVAEGIDLGLGYRVDYFNNVGLAAFSGPAGGPGSGSSNALFHGPFVSILGKM